jgi:thymidylate synthase
MSIKHHSEEQQYLDLLRDILDNGNREETAGGTRTGTPAIRVFDRSMRFDLSDGSVPFLTTKKIPIKSTIAELLWVMNGERKLTDLLKRGCTFWTPWPYKRFLRDMQIHATGDVDISSEDFTTWIMGTDAENIASIKPEMKVIMSVLEKANYRESYDDMGPLYGYQWRNWTTYDFVTKVDKVELFRESAKGIDQLANVLEALRNTPYTRQATVLTSWNVAELDYMELPPCHACHINHFVSNGRLHVKTVQRSADAPVGLPINIAFYAIYTHVMAKLAGLKPGTLTWSGDNCHIYTNQVEGVEEQLQRETLGQFPKLTLPDISELADLKYISVDSFEFSEYKHLPAIKYEVAV